MNEKPLGASSGVIVEDVFCTLEKGCKWFLMLNSSMSLKWLFSMYCIFRGGGAYFYSCTHGVLMFFRCANFSHSHPLVINDCSLTKQDFNVEKFYS